MWLRQVFHVHPPSSIDRATAIPEVARDLDAPWLRNRRLGDVHADDEAWQEEHWPTILTGKMAVTRL